LAASWAALTAASWSFFSWAARASAAATSMSCALAGLLVGTLGRGGRGPGRGPGLGAGAAGLAGAGRSVVACSTGFSTTCSAAFLIGAGFFAAGLAGACSAGAADRCCSAASTSRNRRATGASTVLDADLTNSPISFNLASTLLLSVPNSLASSCTRALPATALLISRPGGQTRSTSLVQHPKPVHHSDFIVRSCRSTYLVRFGPGLATRAVRCSSHPVPAHVRSNRADVRTRSGTGQPQRPPEGTAPLGEREASRVRMQMSAPARLSAKWIGNQPATGRLLDRDNTQQRGGWRTLPAAHTGADRKRATYHVEAYPSA
jgi:hypothetical protein